MRKITNTMYKYPQMELQDIPNNLKNNEGLLIFLSHDLRRENNKQVSLQLEKRRLRTSS